MFRGPRSNRGRTSGGRSATRSSALQLLVALAVIAAALHDPFQAAIAVAGLVGVVLVEAGFAPRFAGGVLRVFGIDGAGKYGAAGCDRCRCGRGSWRRCG